MSTEATATVRLARVLARGATEPVETRTVEANVSADGAGAREIARREFSDVPKGHVVFVHFDGCTIRLTPSQIK